MPRYCSEPNCSTIVASGKCDAHAKQIDRARGSAHARGYTRKWSAYSKSRLQRLPLCGHREDGTRSPEHSVCARDEKVVAASCTDHIVPPSTVGESGDREFDRMFWDRENHQSLCNQCHSLKTATEDSGFAPKKRALTSNPLRYVVSGSGASAWVSERARHGIDLVFDFDLIVGAISFCGASLPADMRGRVSWPLMKATLVMRDALMSWLSETRLYSASAFVIVSDPAQAAVIAQQIDARVVTLAPANGEQGGGIGG